MIHIATGGLGRVRDAADVAATIGVPLVTHRDEKVVQY